MSDKNNFDEVFARLKAIFQPYVKKMDVTGDGETCLMLNTRFIMKNKQPLCFGGVRLVGSGCPHCAESFEESGDRGTSHHLTATDLTRGCFGFGRMRCIAPRGGRAPNTRAGIFVHCRSGCIEPPRGALLAEKDPKHQLPSGASAFHPRSNK